MNPDSIMPRIPVGDWAKSGIDWLKANVSGLFDLISQAFTTLNGHLSDALLAVPTLVLILVFALIAWLLRSWIFAIGTVLMFLLVESIDQWEGMLQLFSMVLIATVIAVVIAVPVGVLAARSNTVSTIVKPILDFMQTMPAFVYLIPTVMFFSVGVVPGMVSTVIFSLPPGVRMTELGIRQVDSETVEAGESFGATAWQILRGIQLPLAIPTIMAGINQVIMLALSMAVIAGMVGGQGSGQDVVQGVSSMNLPLGVEAGLAVVILAIFLDRLTAAMGTPASYPRSLVAILHRAWINHKSERARKAEAAAQQNAEATA